MAAQQASKRKRKAARGCRSKERLTREEAVRRTANQPITFYHCPCGGYHLTGRGLH